MKRRLPTCSSKSRNPGATVVAHLVDEGLAEAQAVAVAASHEFGVPLFDLDALDLDLDVAQVC